MARHTCPSCGGDGGVLLFTQVAPCDTCKSMRGRGGSARFRLVEFIWGGWASLPPGAVAFDIWSAADTFRRKVDEMRRAIAAGEPLERYGSDRVKFRSASTAMVSVDGGLSTEFSHAKGMTAVAVVSAAVTTRPPRIVGSVPDPWYGASARFRWAEGRPIRMVLQAGDVPAVAVLHSWMEYEGSSAPDCGFKELAESLRLQLRRHDMWHSKLPATNRERAEEWLREDRVLLLID